MLDDRFTYQSTIDEATYTRERDQLREGIFLTEMDLADAQWSRSMSKALSRQPRTSSVMRWRCGGRGTLDQPERLQRRLFPEGLKWDRGAF